MHPGELLRIVVARLGPRSPDVRVEDVPALAAGRVSDCLGGLQPFSASAKLSAICRFRLSHRSVITASLPWSIASQHCAGSWHYMSCIPLRGCGWQECSRAYLWTQSPPGQSRHGGGGFIGAGQPQPRAATENASGKMPARAKAALYPHAENVQWCRCVAMACGRARVMPPDAARSCCRHAALKIKKA